VTSRWRRRDSFRSVRPGRIPFSLISNSVSTRPGPQHAAGLHVAAAASLLLLQTGP
jgi:hypothetical protein